MNGLTGIVLALSLLVACSKKAEPPPASTGSGSAATGSAMTGSAAGSDQLQVGSGAGSGSAVAAAGSGEGSGSASDVPMSHRAGNCPSTVLNAKTTDKVVGKTVVVTITSDDKDAISAIQKRTEELLKEKAAPHPTSGATHDQKGGHGGGTGLCPVYLPEGATATS